MRIEHFYGKVTVTSPGNRNSKAIPKGSFGMEGCNSCLGCSHSQPPSSIPGNPKDNTTAEEFCNFLTVMELSLESSGFCAQSWAGTLPWVQEFRRHKHTESGQCHTRGAELGVRDKPGPGGATTTLGVCLSFCPVLPGVPSIPESCPEWTQPVWEAVLGSQPRTSHCRAA